MISILQYINALTYSHGLTRRLGDIDVCLNGDGRMIYYVGNSAIVFKILYKGRYKILKCYTRPKSRLAQIYGDRLLEKELFVHTDNGNGRWVDVVLDDWIEGTTLHVAISDAARSGDGDRLSLLARKFDALAYDMLLSDMAHGDLKPENIVVTPDGDLRLIDLDATFLPAFAGGESGELGTTAFQHPSRTVSDFDRHLDDYPIALISTTLHALAEDPTLYDRFADIDGVLLDACCVGSCDAYKEVLSLFEQRGLAVQYRIARLLLCTSRQLPILRQFMGYLVDDVCASETCDLELFVENGLCGYRNSTGVVIPALYDDGFDFTESLGAVRLGGVWHYIDSSGCSVINCGYADAVKPFCRGRGLISRDGARWQIDHNGLKIE